MSVLPKESIEVIAQTIGINNLSPDVALSLAPDVEYRMREIMQEAIKCMLHSKRTTLTVDDVDTALNLRNVEPIYGFASGDPLRFKKAIGHKNLFYVEDKDLELKDVIEAALPKAPLDTSVVCHWLAIEGVQPAIPENPSAEAITAPAESRNYGQKDGGVPVEIRLPVKHVLSEELQLYFGKITELTLRGSESTPFKQALLSVATDAGLHPLIPYFTFFIADEVSHGLNNLTLLFGLMRVVRSLLQNPHINLEPYLHELMPSVVTCLVARRLGSRLADNHWELRDFSANIIASICKRYRCAYDNLQTRLTKTLLRAFLDPKQAMTQHYGAIEGLTALGPNVVRRLVLPNLEPYLRLLEPEMVLETQKNAMKRHEAWHVYGALLRSAGRCICSHLKVFPDFLCRPAQSLWRANARVITTRPGKRAKKAAMDDGPMDLGLVSVEGEEERGLVGSGGKENGDGVRLKMAAVLAEVWKEELDSGRLLVSLVELFGESIFPFIPAPEMSLFL